MVGDACDLPDLGKFGCVFAANLICRLPEPADFYSRLPDMIVPGGLLFITSPYTWLETYTEKVKRRGGRYFIEDLMFFVHPEQVDWRVQAGGRGGEGVLYPEEDLGA